jgi:hypothetical protein
MIHPLGLLRPFGLERFREHTELRIKWMWGWFGSTIITEMTLPPLGVAPKILESVERTAWKLFVNILKHTASL